MMSRAIFSLIILFPLLAGCTETIPDLKGSLVGYIRSLDEFARFNNDEEGFEVSVRGVDYYITHTDKNGRFEFGDLPAGTYELSVYKTGYGMIKEYSVQHLGGAPTILHLSSSVVDKYYLYRIPLTRISEVSVANGTITAKFNFASYVPEVMSIQVFYSDIEGFSEKDIKVNLHYNLRKNGDWYTAGFYSKSFPFNAGQKIYLRACIRNWQSDGISFYYDPELGRNVYPNLGAESDESSFILGQ